MKKRVLRFYIVSIVMAVGLLTSCENIFPSPDDPYYSKDMDINKSILIYMAADNNLSSFADKNLASIKDGFVPDFFTEGKGDVLLIFVDKRYETPKLLRLSKDEFGVVHTEVVAEYEEVDSSSDSLMNSVLTHASSLFPAKENGLILWSHGTGWLPDGYYNEPYSKLADGMSVPMSSEKDPYADLVKSFGVDNGHEMEIPDLAKALPVHYSFVIFDACLMGGVEVAYELKDKCDYLVASPAEILAEGFPYKKIMEPLFKEDVRSGLVDICKMYYEHYDSMGEGATIALHDMSAMSHLADVCSGIFASGRDSISNIDMSRLQGFFRMNRHWFYDMEDFISNIATEEQMLAYQEAISDVVLYKAATEKYNLGGNTQFYIHKFCGLSSYVPNPTNSVLDSYYKNLAWNKAVCMIE